ncbi:MAG: Amuc_1099 family pilus-like system protein [Chthoniobacteraceae bacterium]
MDWIKKNYDRFALAVLAAALIGVAALLFTNVNTFSEQFAEAMAPVMKNNKIAEVDTTKIDEAKEQFEKPAQWTPRQEGKDLLHSGLLFTAEPYYVNKSRMLTKPGSDSLYNDSLTGKPMPNAWFMKNNLALLDPAVQFLDPDNDGFLNEDEWRANTDPNKPDSHPSYESKLFLKDWLKQPFRFKFQAYDGDPKKDKAEDITFQINPLDAGGRTKFLKIGEMIEGTKFKVSKFEFKEVPNPGTGDSKEVSELTLTHVETNETVQLIYNQVTDSPTQFAQLEYFWKKKQGEAGQVFVVPKFKDFVLLQPNLDPKQLYKLLDVNNDGALIQRPDGEKYQVPRFPKK